MNYIDVEMEVRIRRNEVNVEALKELLISHRRPPQEVADELHIPKTQAEHYFRRDKYFAIPTPEVWYELKRFLGIQTNEFDKSIMEFDWVGGEYDMRNRIYVGDTSPTLTAQCGNNIYLLGI